MSKNTVQKIKDVIEGLGDSKFILVEDFPGFKKNKIGVEPSTKYITLLIECQNKDKKIINPGGGKYLSIVYDVECDIKSKGKPAFKKNFTVIKLKTKEKDIQNYFIELCVILVNKLGHNPLIEDVKLQFEKLESIFIKLSTVSTKSIIGLWGELFLISISSNPTNLINAWHIDSRDKFDFNDGKDKIEVKTTKLSKRKHFFDILQLRKYPGSDTFIASILTSKIDNGNSIPDLISQIKSRVSSESFEKLISKTFVVIGDKINEIGEEKYDYKMAASQLNFYYAEDIPKPELIPENVGDVKFSSYLEDTPFVHTSKFKGSILRNFK